MIWHDDYHITIVDGIIIFYISPIALPVNLIFGILDLIKQIPPIHETYNSIEKLTWLILSL